MKTFAERLLEDRRLVLLRILDDQVGRVANSSVLTWALEVFGHNVSRDYVRTQLAWLAEQGLVTVEVAAESNNGPVVLATLTERGRDVVRDKAAVPGVARPGG